LPDLHLHLRRRRYAVAGRCGTVRDEQEHAGAARREHLETKLARAKAAVSLSAESLWSRVLSLQQEVETVLAEARRTKNHSLTLSAIARAEKLIALQGAILSSARAAAAPAETSSTEDALEEIRRRRRERRAIQTTTVDTPESGPETSETLQET